MWQRCADYNGLHRKGVGMFVIVNNAGLFWSGDGWIVDAHRDA